jgi:hypothetical protein
MGETGALTTRLKILVALAMVLALGVGGFLALRRTPAPPAPTVPAATPVPPPAHTCLLPGPAPVPPDGATATAADIGLGHDTIQAFVEQLEAYQACMDDKADHPAPGLTAAQKQSLLEQGDAAIDQANALAAAFSEQLKIFKARTPAKP